ncbi:MAG: diadenylate cyclase [Syntrophobacterales bacterium]|nr:diadenylate cyclase [Syntrophobacterales bacterium]
MKSLIPFLKTVRWQDVLDVLINSYILFRVYILFRHTNAFRVIIGIGILWVFQKIATSLGLVITSWILQAVIALAAIIIIVVFRNELRLALQVQNLRSFLWGGVSKQSYTPAQVITDTVMQMGKKRIGAIIVIPGREDISELVHGGIPWHGKVSQEMIISIFWPNNPVHDGAIIIDGDEIKEVAVLLPLSQRSDLPTFYGTRHRAALGLAERSDALVIVVSEERGRVSIAKNGSIGAVSDPEVLHKTIREHVNPIPEKRTKWWNRTNLQTAFAALASFVIISGAWFSFTRSKDVVMSVEVPIEFLNRPVNYEIIEVNPPKVTLNLAGSSALMKSIKPQQIEVRIDLRKASEGKNLIPITQENIFIPPGILINRVEPSFVEVILDTLTSKEVSIQVDWKGHLDDRLIITEVKVSPSKLIVVGGKSILSNLNTLYTAPVSLEDIRGSGSTSVPVIIMPPSIKLAPNYSDRVVVEYTVKDRRTMEIVSP